MNGYNFTERVRKVLSLAREEALRLRSDRVGTEHVVLGLRSEGQGVATTVLFNLGVDLANLRKRAESAVTPGTSTTTVAAEVPYDMRTKRMLEFSMREARELQHSYVGTEHL